MTAANVDNEHETVELLLPWYVNGTLDPEEHQLVERHLDRCAICRENLAMLSEIQDVVRQDDPTPLIAEPPVDALLLSLDKKLDEKPGEDLKGKPEKRSATFGKYRRTTPVAIAASTLLATIMVVVVMTARDIDDPQISALPDGDPLSFTTQTVPPQTQTLEYVFEIAFMEGSDSMQHERILTELGANEISELDDGGRYRMVIRMPAASLAELERIAARIGDRPEIQSAEAVAMQIPVR